jgi:hypothetical protein
LPLCAIDISKAFDSIDHTLLLEQIGSTTLHQNIIRWLAAYVQGCTAHCLYSIALSSRMIICTGVPQGSVLSLALFNFFILDCPGNDNVLSWYADDISGTETDSNLTTLSGKLQAVVTPVTDWAARKKLCIAPAKSQVTLFTPWTQQFNVCPDISINGVNITLCWNPKILGVTFDTMFSFAQHVLSVATKALQRLKIIKAVSGS